MLERYFWNNEKNIDDIFARVANTYGDNPAHSDRLYQYMKRYWFMPSTPILSNGGTSRGLPISCFVNEVDDNLQSIADTWNESVWLASRGGGIGTYWGNVRSIGEKIKYAGNSSGVIPFIVVQDALSTAISQGSLRRGSSAAYIPVSHPEIEEFIDIRRPTGGDYNRKALNIHNAVVITDEFMHAVENGDKWYLRSPVSGEIVSTLNARDLWIKIIIARIETGEPYILFHDNANKHIPECYKLNALSVKTSNLCSEIMLHTGKDSFCRDRTAVCCLSSVNLEYYDEWKDDDEEGDSTFILDIMRFLDNVLQYFIDNAPDTMLKAKYSAWRERSVGLGVMGFHSMLQRKMIPFDSMLSKALNRKIFSNLKRKIDKASKLIAKEKGSCPDAEEVGLLERFSHKMAVAPTASISVIAQDTSPGIEPYISNSFVRKTLSGSSMIKNRHLMKLLIEKGENNDSVWSSITTSDGSVQHLDFLDDFEKAVFKTAFEIPQETIIDLAANRQKFIDQGQSINLFLRPNISKKELHDLHFRAWKKGLKSLYYCRSKSIQRTEKVSICEVCCE